MIKTLLLIILTLTVTTVSGQSKSTDKAVIKTTLYCDHCKVCETCGKKFQSELYKIKGIKMYELDETAQTITVYFNPKKTNLSIIKMAISQLGFDADDIKADSVAYESLDDCCKK